jgi:hypothetical protein
LIGVRQAWRPASRGRRQPSAIPAWTVTGRSKPSGPSMALSATARAV